MKDRHLKIMNLVNAQGQISVRDLSQKLNVSVVTMRKDLDELESMNLLRKEHGYAARVSTDAIDFRMSLFLAQKQKIAQRAVHLVEPNETIMIESGSTCALFALELAKASNVTIITNSAYIARSLHNVPMTNVVLLGGDYDPISEVTTGPVTKLCAQEYHVDKFFIGIDGYTEESGFTNLNHTRCSTVRDIALCADKIIALTTSDKFGKRSVARLFSPDEIHTVVTDSHIPDEYARNLKSHGVQLELVDF